MTPRQIQKRLRARNITQEELAEELAVSKVSISRVIHKKTISRRLMEAIAERIDSNMRAVFPEYFDPKDLFGKHLKRRLKEPADPEQMAA